MTAETIRTLQKQLNKKSEGSSLVEVIVAFGILMIALSLFTTALYQSVNVSRSSEKLRSENRKAVEDFYSGGKTGNPVFSGSESGNAGSFVMKRADGEMFAIQGEAMKYTKVLDDGSEYILYFFKGVDSHD